MTDDTDETGEVDEVEERFTQRNLSAHSSAQKTKSRYRQTL